MFLISDHCHSLYKQTSTSSIVTDTTCVLVMESTHGLLFITTTNTCRNAFKENFISAQCYRL